MRNTLKDCLKTFKNDRKNKARGYTVLLVLSIIVSVNVFLGLRQTGLALAGTASCGQEEHTHGEECYDTQLLCVKEEHVHSVSCYSDPDADVETQLDWQKMFEGFQTGDLRADVVSIAKSQIGYTESLHNFAVDDNLVRSGYTRYGAWYGAPYSEWSAMFASFCMHYAGADNNETPYNIGAFAMAELWGDNGRYALAGEYTPEYGDLIFFDNNTVGIISSVNFDVLTVIKGDVENAVAEQTVMTYDDGILGYGILVAPERYSADLKRSVDSAECGIVLESCNCGNEGAEAISHADICAYKSQLTTLACEKTAEELYAIWSQLPDDAGEYILQYLTNNAWQHGTKAEDLKALINGTVSNAVLNASCGNILFRMDGKFPETAKFRVVDPQYSRDEIFSYINPNIHNNVNWSAVYDLAIMDGDSAYTPTSPVRVSVTIPDLIFDAENEFFAVAHLDEATGEMLSSEYVDVIDNTVTFTATGFSPYMFYTVDQEVEGGERILDTNWLSRKDRGFFTYWEQFLPDTESPAMMSISASELTDEDDPNDIQINKWGGESTNNDGVIVSKTIDGTELENVFDITLTVQTQQSISEIYEEPDMAVVIVMDISQTMNNDFGDITRYEAAMLAAENFLDNFAAQSGDLSKIGYVAFNTDAHEIFGLTTCSNSEKAVVLKNEMRKATEGIIDDAGYASSHTRFTNIEAGLKMGYDMLASAQNEHKYLIFLSDGFPTTYISSEYNGYDPYTSSGTSGADGVFYDDVINVHCDYGTSYSDKAAVRAREMADEIKENDVTIFSIGVDVGGQTIQQYINNAFTDSDGVRQWQEDGTPAWESFSVVDCGDGTVNEPAYETPTYNYQFEIGDAASTASYINWLQNSIGSGYYYDSTNAEGLQEAYEKIFDEILRLKEESSEADWVAQDPIPLAPPEYLEFIGFYDKNGTLQSTDTDLSGLSGEEQENTAGYSYDSATNLNTISWDLKRSGYDKATTDGVTTYAYQLVYRVRLKNELEGFIENHVYDTNAPTSLTYRVFESENGVTTLSEQRTLRFKIPAVHGYLAELSFTKKDSYGNTLAGAEFLLAHDDTACPICRGDGMNCVAVPDYTGISAADGTVSFTGIPSGHAYTLQEIKAPPGYIGDNKKYKVVVAYDVLMMEAGWTGEIINKTGPVFPSTGGSGTLAYILTGVFLVTTPAVYGYIRRRKQERGYARRP